MIRINLLPVEKRRAERVPIGRLSHVYIAVAAAGLVALGVIFWLTRTWQLEGEIADKKQRTKELNAALAAAQMEVNGEIIRGYDKLKTERARMKGQIDMIRGIVTRDLEWWEAVDAIWDEIQAHPKVWIDRISAVDFQTAGGTVSRSDIDAKTAPPVPYTIMLQCHVAGSDVAEMTRFRNALKDNKTIQRKLTYININPDWSVDEEEGYREDHSIAFGVALYAPPPNMKPNEVEVKATDVPAAPDGTPGMPPPPGGTPPPPNAPPPPGGSR